jgi:hypothetical protein
MFQSLRQIVPMSSLTKKPVHVGVTRKGMKEWNERWLEVR